MEGRNIKNAGRKKKYQDPVVVKVYLEREERDQLRKKLGIEENLSCKIREFIVKKIK